MRMKDYPGKALQSASADGHASDMLYRIPVHLYERCARPHAHDNHPVQPAAVFRPEGIRHEFIRPGCGPAIQAAVNIRTADTREHHLFHRVKVYVIVINILAECSEKGSNRIGCGDELRGAYFSILYSYNFRGTPADINSYYHGIISLRISSKICFFPDMSEPNMFCC